MPACPENRSRYAGSRSPEAARPLRPSLSFEDAVEPVAEQVKAEDGRQDRQGRRRRRRSEEHTSELQSQSNLVCRLLLEKKKKGVRLPRQRSSRSCCSVRPTLAR